MPKPGSDYRAIIDYVSGFDATDALDYFLNNLNQGRPFIIAGHSQGSAILGLVLKVVDRKRGLGLEEPNIK